MRKRLIVLGVLAALIVAVGGWRVWRMTHRPPDVTLPTFTEPSSQPRAPSSEGLGVKVGFTKLAEVKELLNQRRLTCEDTSARALMMQARERKKKEREEKEAKGIEVDAVSSASLNKKSQMEKNPQVRLTCNDVTAASLGDRVRPSATGRWLFVFDGPELPLRHVSYRRVHAEQNEALADFDAAVQAMTARFGPPHVRTGEIGATMAVPAAETSGGSITAQKEGGEKGTDQLTQTEIFPKLTPLKRQWNYSDIQVKVDLINYGKRGIDLLESVEVPWPVRPDAPSLPSGSLPPAPAP